MLETHTFSMLKCGKPIHSTYIWCFNTSDTDATREAAAAEAAESSSEDAEMAGGSSGKFGIFSWENHRCWRLTVINR